MSKNQKQPKKKSVYSNSARIWALILAVLMFAGMLTTGIYYLVATLMA